MKTTIYDIRADIPRNINVAHLSDLHGRRCSHLAEKLRQERPDIIAVTGDFCRDNSPASERALKTFRELAQVAPTFYSLGNHEIGITAGDIEKIESTGVVVLDDRYTEAFGMKIGGITSGFLRSGIGNGRDNPHLFGSPAPSTEWLDAFEREQGYKILLCHHPEYYFEYLRERRVDLVLSGHAHGGQIRLFGRGLMAPGQGFFPKYTSGVHENRLVISRGMSNTAKIIPRLFNPCEIVIIRLTPSGKPLTDKIR